MPFYCSSLSAGGGTISQIRWIKLMDFSFRNSPVSIHVLSGCFVAPPQCFYKVKVNQGHLYFELNNVKMPCSFLYSKYQLK